MRKLNLTLMLLMLAICSFGQNVPAYVPTNGLVGWWPFNGNANDESGNGNNGTVNGATLTSDRFGNNNCSYNFNGTNDFILVPDNSSLDLTNQFTLSAWMNSNSVNNDQYILGKPRSVTNTGFSLGFRTIQGTMVGMGLQTTIPIFTNTSVDAPVNVITNNSWHFIVGSYDGITAKIYIDGQLLDTITRTLSLENSSQSLNFGREFSVNPFRYFSGQLDDIGIWNRALTQQEITALYNANLCYQTISVTDTLFINTNITGFNPVTYENTIRIWPNPTNDHITIDAGDLNAMNGYSIRIINSLGQQMFQSAINQQQFYLDLSTWTGNGMYFVHITDPNGNIIDIKKIVLR